MSLCDEHVQLISATRTKKCPDGGSCDEQVNKGKGKAGVSSSAGVRHGGKARSLKIRHQKWAVVTCPSLL